MMYDQKQQKLIMKKPLFCDLRYRKLLTATLHSFSDQQQRISDFHFTIITAKRAHDCDVIAISRVLLGKYVLYS